MIKYKYLDYTQEIDEPPDSADLVHLVIVVKIRYHSKTPIYELKCILEELPMKVIDVLEELDYCRIKNFKHL